MPHTFFATLALLLAPLSLLASDTSQWAVRPEGSIYFTAAQPSLTKVTHKTVGYGAQLGIATHISGTDVPVRIGFGMDSFPGGQSGSIKSSLYHSQIFADVFLPTGLRNTTWFLGLSGNRYHIKNEGQETWTPDPSYPSYANPGSVFALTAAEVDRKNRAGFRAGLDYRYNRNLAVEFLFQTTELGLRKAHYMTYPNGSKAYAGTVGNVNPSWLQIGIRYTY
jgi:hypothetical protein